jgi:exopolysaccharide biosynthesis polyprenyl glycosylphosphotransferase
MLRKSILLVSDMGILLVGWYWAFAMAGWYNMIQLNIDSYLSIVLIMLVAAGFLFNINGLFSLERRGYSDLLLSLAVALFNLFIILLAVSFFMREVGYVCSISLFAIILQFVLLALWKYVYLQIERAISVPQNALLIGSKEECAKIAAYLNTFLYLNYNVRYTDYEYQPWSKVADIDLIIICSDLSLKERREIVNYCHLNNKQVFMIPDVYELFCSSVEMSKFDDIPVFRPQKLKPCLEQRLLKRILDICVASIGALIGCPIMLLIAIAIKLETAGPILYSQTRVGRDEKEFKVYKFRSMYQNAEEVTGPVLTVDNDSRITKVGKFIRATRLDELPQIFNVLLGDMSIVGPRPERPIFVEQFKSQIAGYHYRHNVKPGITGMAQVHGKYNTNAKVKLIYDLIYIQKCSVVTDLIIMIQTVRVLVSKSSTEGIILKKADLKQYQAISKNIEAKEWC